MKESEEVDGHSKDRVAALTDGIYSVAMTLLVIDLKLPDGIETTRQPRVGARAHRTRA